MQMSTQFAIKELLNYKFTTICMTNAKINRQLKGS